MKIFLNQQFQGLKITIKPAKRWRDQQGNPKMSNGEYIQFEDGVYRTDDPKKIKILERYMSEHSGEITVLDESDINRRKKIEAKVTEQMGIIEELKEYGCDPAGLEKCDVMELEKMLVAEKKKASLGAQASEEKADIVNPAEIAKRPAIDFKDEIDKVEEIEKDDIASIPDTEVSNGPNESCDPEEINQPITNPADPADPEDPEDPEEIDLVGMSLEELLEFADEEGIVTTIEERNNADLLRAKIEEELTDPAPPNLDDEPG